MTRCKLAACVGGLVVLGMGCFAARAQAQELPPKTYMSKNVFYLPVKIDDRMRASLREVQLYSKDDPNKSWVLRERASPSQTYFTFRAPHDGEYWFTVVIVDKTGRPVPADIRKEMPGLIVVLDTQQPQVDVQQVPSATEGTCFRCIVKDENPDMAKTRFYYQTGDSVWRPLAPMANQMDQYCIPAQAVFTGMVKVEAGDLAGNTVNREFNMSAAKNTALTASPDKGPAVKNAPMNVDSMSSRQPAAFPVEQVGGQEVEPQLANNNNNPQLANNNNNLQLANNSNPPAAFPTAADTHTAKNMPSDTPSESAPNVIPGAVGTSQRMGMASVHQVNKTHAFLQYQIDHIGPSGIGKVEVWLTRNKGQTWQKLSEDSKQPSLIEVDLPGEGVFGIRLVMSNGRGFGATPPSPGDTPDWWIEVDTTKPQVELRGLRMGTAQDSGCVFITWAAQDKNLTSEPIDLYFALAPDGPWQPIAQNLKNDGHFCWRMPAYLGTEAFVRVIAHDTAGNATIADFPQPVPLDDMSRPRGRLTGITTMAPFENDNTQPVDLRK